MYKLHLHKTLLIFLLPFLLLAQSQKKDGTKLTYDELKNLYFDNEKDSSKQIEYAKAYLVKANNDNIAIRKAKAYYYFALLYYQKDDSKTIRYLDSVIKYSLNSNDKYFPSAAYCEKADFLKKQYKFKEAMANYILAEKATLKTNIDYYYNVRNYIGITKSEDLGEYKEALVIYKECYHYYNKKDVNNPAYSSYYQNVIFGIADCYKSLNKTDSTSYYNKLGYQEAKKTKNEEYKYLFVLNEGANQVLKKNYKVAIDSVNKALPQMIAFNNKENTLAAYYYLGKAYEGLNNNKQAAKNFIKVDSLYTKTKNYSIEFISGYHFLINYYKNQGDKINQLKYITTYMSIDSILQKNYKKLNKLVQDEYDTPHLISEKEALIQSLEHQNTKSYWGIAGLILLSISFSSFSYYQYRLNRIYKSRFEKILNRDKIPKENFTDSNSNETATQPNNKKELGIAEELVTQIIEKLNLFETKEDYLQSNITVQLLADKLETNSKYLSKIVNTHKEKTFTKYINDLRVEYAIRKLQQDKKLRNYTIQAIAVEFGFNNAESFSTAFHKNTGLKPTYFIENINKTKSTS